MSLKGVALHNAKTHTTETHYSVSQLSPHSYPLSKAALALVIPFCLGMLWQHVYLQRLEGYPYTLAPVIEGWAAAVARVDSCIYLDPQELCRPMHITGDLDT